MKMKLYFTIIFLKISLGLFAQGKFYIVPQVFAFVGSYKGVNSVNKKQSFIKSRNFTKKDFLVGFNLSYNNEPITISVGIEQAAYSTGFRYEENKRIYTKEAYSGLNLINYYLEFKYEKWSYNIKIPKRWRTEKNANKFLIVSKISPFVGLDYWRFNKNTSQQEKPLIRGEFISIPGILDFYPRSRNNLGIRTGVDWAFYNGEKRKFVLTISYKFGLQKLGYYQYHFENPSRGIDFYYQTTTRGNGFSIKAGFPIKLFEFNKKNKKI